jgi:general stress protein 26
MGVNQMTKEEIYCFIQKHKLGVLATVSTSNVPEAALVGIAVTPNLELVFDTLAQTRKCQNLRLNPKIAFVIGWDDEITLQYEGEAEEPKGSELERYKKVYFEKWPDGVERENWPDITYFKVRPKWIRYSNFNEPQQIIEQTFKN